jgi:hypothetical protein
VSARVKAIPVRKNVVERKKRFMVCREIVRNRQGRADEAKRETVDRNA